MKGLIIISGLMMLASILRGEQVDPRFPAERVPEAPLEWPRWLPTRIEQLEAEQAQLLEQISVLPQYDPKFLSDHIGYHSLIGDLNSDETASAHRISITYPWIPMIDSIALVPAFDPAGTEGEPHAFPKRFKIEVLNPATGEFATFVDWLEEDFPDPGPYPVFFSGVNQAVKEVRITVPQAKRGAKSDYYALGEIYVFRRGEEGGVGANSAAWENNVLKVSDSFSLPPHWDATYLTDGVDGFGLPLSDKTFAAEDFMITYADKGSFDGKVQFLLDLGQLRTIGRIVFWPAATPDSLVFPSFGFPKKIMVEISPDPDFESKMVFNATHTIQRMYRDNLLSLIGDGHKAQYIRITMEGLSEYKGRPILGLGEISISDNERVWSINSKIAAQGIPEKDLGQLPRLVDGYSHHHRILTRGEWIKGLAQRRPLDRRLSVVEQELEQSRVAWRLIQQRVGIWGGTSVVAGLILGMVLQRRQRYRILDRLRWRITRDLHDEVGSNLGSISIMSERLKHAEMDAVIKEEIFEISLLAREACASLREVVWVIEHGTIRLPALIQKLIERAERVLSDVELSVDIAPDCPDVVLPLTLKRHFTMFFKEVVHNCVRHAQATQVWIAVSMVEQHLQISVRDNGCGFNPSEETGGWGLSSMKKRAEEMGGKMELISQPGRGVTIVLDVPLANLSSEPDNGYTTST